jgi:hypothetical protein
MSVKVITKVSEAKAGSIPNPVNIIGINAPKKDPNARFNNRDNEITHLNIMSSKNFLF